MRYTLLIAIFMFAATSSFAAEDTAIAPTMRGPAVGAVIPSDLTSIDQKGDPRSFENLSGPNGLVLVFIRSAKWCSFCKKQLAEVDAGAKEITTRGYALAVLSYDSLGDIQRYAHDHKPNFTMLSDRKSEVIDAFGIRNEKFGKMHYANGVPHPMIFVIGADKTVQAKLAEEGYKNRPSVTAITEAIDVLSSHE